MVGLSRWWNTRAALSDARYLFKNGSYLVAVEYCDSAERAARRPLREAHWIRARAYAAESRDRHDFASRLEAEGRSADANRMRAAAADYLRQSALYARRYAAA